MTQISIEAMPFAADLLDAHTVCSGAFDDGAWCAVNEHCTGWRAVSPTGRSDQIVPAVVAGAA
jgi:hypothetical protein